MSNVNFADILNKTADDVKAPLPLPEGTYSAVVTDYSNDVVGQKQTPACRVNFKLTGHEDDVEEDELDPNWKEKTYNTIFYLTENALFRYKNFLTDALGLDSGQTLAELQNDMRNQPFSVYCKQRQVQRDDGSVLILNDFTEFKAV